MIKYRVRLEIQLCIFCILHYTRRARGVLQLDRQSIPPPTLLLLLFQEMPHRIWQGSRGMFPSKSCVIKWWQTRPRCMQRCHGLLRSIQYIRLRQSGIIKWLLFTQRLKSFKYSVIIISVSFRFC